MSLCKEGNNDNPIDLGWQRWQLDQFICCCSPPCCSACCCCSTCCYSLLQSILLCLCIITLISMKHRKLSLSAFFVWPYYSLCVFVSCTCMRPSYLIFVLQIRFLYESFTYYRTICIGDGIMSMLTTSIMLWIRQYDGAMSNLLLLYRVFAHRTVLVLILVL